MKLSVWLLIQATLFVIGYGMLVLVLLASLAFAEPVALQWNKAKDATSYELEVSTDQGETWTVQTPVITCLVTICKTQVDVPDERYVLIRVVSVNAGDRVPRADRGIWACAPCRPVEGVTRQQTP